ncbi:MAG: alpha/beta fold hydrolase, partial [Myxococcota bacterium]|nr:alpha/beta fold hydrolase [Myxococcota bacterium]
LVPVPGLPLRERTTYAAVLTSALRAADGGPVRPDPRLSMLLSEEEPDDPALRADWQRYRPLRAYVAAHPFAGSIVGATVFTTQDATSLMHRLRQAVHRTPPPEPLELTFIRDHDGLCHIYHGRFSSPNFQVGQPPYLRSGGYIAVDEDGMPQPQRTEELRFALSVPNAPMPPDGWPVALYAHGTGGDFESFIREGIDLRAAHIEAGGRLMARMAVISIDQVLHGPRDPSHSPEELTFFNLTNIVAARDNPRQSAADYFQLVRLVQGMSIAAAPVTRRPIRFDPRRIYFVGHSQGGLIGPLFLAAEPAVRAAVLSGAGAVLVLSLLHKRRPADVASLVSGLLQEPAGPDHPFLHLLQAYFEPADPNNYGRLIVREPPPGMAPKSVFQSLGVTDLFTPLPNIKALALSLGVQPVLPALTDIEDLALAGLSWASPPVAGNVAAGQATAVLRQYAQREPGDGHYVLFDRLQARQDWSRFLGTDIAHGLPHLR